MGKKIALIHTTPVTIPVLGKLIREKAKPEAELEMINLLDDSILPEINREGRITEAVQFRINLMLTMGTTAGAEAFLCACSSIGKAIEDGSAVTHRPVFRIDEPMASLAAGYTRAGIAATLQSTLGPTGELIERRAAEAGKQIQLQNKVIEGVGSLLAQGKEAEYDRIVSEALKELRKDCEIVVLAQASMARALEAMPEEERAFYLTSPVTGVEAFLKQIEAV